MKYKGAPVELTPEEDEIAHFYAKVLTCQQLQEEKSAKVFNANFFRGFKKAREQLNWGDTMQYGMAVGDAWRRLFVYFIFV